LTLDDFKWAWAVTRIGEVVDSFRPGAIIFEYVKLGYLIDGLTAEQRNQIVCLVDTHDVLHLRAEQFQAHGFPHWLKIDRAEEGSVLKRFDAVIAIQENEARLFREMTDSRVRVITAGHAVDAEDEAATSEEREQTPDKITVGYIGSKNFSNWQAIREFLLCAWPTVLERNKSVCELVIAGGICEWFDAEPELQHPPDGGEAANLVQHFSPTDLENVQLLGPIESIRDFYNRIDVVINPVQFGTGLKIKNAESLRFGKLLITTLNGFDGMPEATRLACMVVENVNEMGLAINSICNDLNSIRPMQQLAFQLAQTEFSESQAYSELKRFLEL
jgi:glycosyltransferase involved in cell wall biosynthesis